MIQSSRLIHQDAIEAGETGTRSPPNWAAIWHRPFTGKVERLREEGQGGVGGSKRE